MVRYFYAWTPLVIVGAVVLLAVPYLGLIAAALIALVALAALVWTIVSVTYSLGRAVSRRWQRLGASARPTPALSPARHQTAQPIFEKAHVS